MNDNQLIPEAAVEATARALRRHRQVTPACCDHEVGWCCECGTHEIRVPWSDHAARAVVRGVELAGSAVPGTFAGHIAARAYADIQHDKPTA